MEGKDERKDKPKWQYKRKAQANGVTKMRRFKEVCKFYVHGNCNKPDCLFSHDAPQIKKTEVCKYFRSGCCSKGDACLFSHDLQSEPCKLFHARGSCPAGEDCRFSHQPLSDIFAYRAFVTEHWTFLEEILRAEGCTAILFPPPSHLMEEGEEGADASAREEWEVAEACVQMTKRLFAPLPLIE